MSIQIRFGAGNTGADFLFISAFLKCISLHIFPNKILLHIVPESWNNSSMKILLYDHIIKHDLTFRQVAELTGVPRSTVSDIANGKTSPTMNQMEQLAAGLKITISDLFESDYK